MMFAFLKVSTEVERVSTTTLRTAGTPVFPKRTRGSFFHLISPVGKRDVVWVSDCRKLGGLLKLLEDGLFANNPDGLRADVSGVFLCRLTETVFLP